MNRQDWNPLGGIRVLRVPKWQMAIILVVALALGIAIAVVATGVFLIALPVAAVAVLVYRLFGRRRGPRDGSIVEGEYEVIDGAAAEHPYERRRR